MASAYLETIKQPSDRVIVAIDNMTWDTAHEIMAEVSPYLGMAKANSIAQELAEA